MTEQESKTFTHYHVTGSVSMDLLLSLFLQSTDGSVKRVDKADGEVIIYLNKVSFTKTLASSPAH